MTICQLSDDNNGGKTDAVYFADTNYTYIDNVENDSRCDWFMRLPKFYYHAEEVEPDIWDIGFGQEPEAEDWKCWDGNDLIGCFKALARDSLLLSIRGVTPSVDMLLSDFKTYAQDRGAGYSLVKWKHHSMMSFLFYAMYGNTNSRAICGTGSSTLRRTTGSTDTLGMTDTVAGVNGNLDSINFWGLESWWGDIEEWVDNVDISGRHYRVSEDDGSIRELSGDSGNGYVYHVYVGEFLDILPTYTRGAGNKYIGFCDFFSATYNSAQHSIRSANVGGLIGLSYAHYLGDSASDLGSRLAFRGDIIVENDVPTFRSIPITNDGYSGTTSP